MPLNQPVDAVITWVDGLDPIHQAKLSSYLAEQGLNKRPEAAAPTRFNQCGELEYCVRSLIRYAPWIRTIYIVTDAQIPSLVSQYNGRVKIIDHREIFAGFEDNLPTFNSVAIETMLWRIKGLSEKFIYLNDDCSLIRSVRYDDFFRGNDLVLRGEWRRMSDRKWFARIKRFLGFSNTPIDEHRQLQENSAKQAGFTQQFLHLPHAPFPLRKSTFEYYYANHPELLVQNSRYPLRSRTQFWPISLAHHLEIQNKTAIIDNTLKTITVNPAFHSVKKIKLRLHHADIDPRVAFICIQSLDEAIESTKEFLFKWLST